MAAEIEAVFHKVYVERKDCDTLRFLCWPNGDLNKEPREYCMVKHLFGVTSSPACANFCLKKTASIYQSEFDPVTVQTVKKNMYVGDLMKTVSSPEIVMRLSSQLRELLAKGGFRLTKWLSNDRKARTGEQFIAKLPEDRITPHKPPFTCVGVDFFGPIEVKWGRSRVKRYGCIFTCLSVCAIHIKVANTLNTDSMINALRRFICLRGCPEIRRNCETNLTKADKELKEAITEWNQPKINGFCPQRGIQWIFNPPRASHMRGAWDRMIRSVHQILKALFKEQVVCDEVLNTVLTEATNILNSGPLTRNNDDVN
ncbi:hypothetical protein AWC38_SpisGene16834 [Stylophora pistillata]|uniref:Integrase catalytic domain-containing protein n=1 Tax=Stylophora pistillata TaxID=50429 RepID=A0A2B4RQE7_STYPI|nr:hypothetical protein AWC38_SpisGene16834 [Stylophora pistillata]